MSDLHPSLLPFDEQLQHHLRLLEALLFASAEPLGQKDLASYFKDDVDVRRLLERLASDYQSRGVHLVCMDHKWAFRTAPDLADGLEIYKQSEKKLSRSAMETLAIIAYHQPVTRAEIEEIRGVSLSKGTMDALLEREWIRPKGRRQTPGRPMTWATTEKFLDHFQLSELAELPGVDELKAMGLLDTRPAITLLGNRKDDLLSQEDEKDSEALHDDEVDLG